MSLDRLLPPQLMIPMESNAIRMKSVYDGPGPTKDEVFSTQDTQRTYFPETWLWQLTSVMSV